MEEKKRSVRRFNVVDIIIVLIIVAGLAFLGMKLLGGSDGNISASARIRYTVTVFDVDKEVASNIMAVQEASGKVQLMANGALVDGYVESAAVGPHITHEADSEGTVISSVEQGEKANVDMSFTIEAAVDSLTTKKVGTQEVRIGKSHIVKTTEYELEGYDAVIAGMEVIG